MSTHNQLSRAVWNSITKNENVISTNLYGTLLCQYGIKSSWCRGWSSLAPTVRITDGRKKVLALVPEVRILPEAVYHGTALSAKCLAVLGTSLCGNGKKH